MGSEVMEKRRPEPPLGLRAQTDERLDEMMYARHDARAADW